jgi:hypothetical protein
MYSTLSARVNIFALKIAEARKIDMANNDHTAHRANNVHTAHTIDDDLARIMTPQIRGNPRHHI